MNRRTFLSSAAATAIASTGVKAATGNKTPAGRPNVLLLMSDQHKRSCMGAHGDTVAKTPNLDALAARSVRFTDAYCTNPICAPSRATILTGLYSHHIGVLDNAEPFAPKYRTMAHHFSAAGYMTAVVGKTHWNDAQTHGFDYHIDFNDWLQFLGPKTQLHADELGAPNSGAGLPQIENLWHDEGDPWKGHRTLDGRKSAVSLGRPSLLAESDHFDEFVARESVRFLKDFGKGDQPFFLMSSFLKPHDPFMPATRFAEMFRGEDMVLPNSWGKADLAKLPKEVVHSIEFNAPMQELRDPSAAKKHIAYYYGNLAQMDDCVGQVVRAVQELGLENDTIICYTSDHGEMLGDLGLWQKFQFYEGSCGVPLMISVPGKSSGVCHTPVSLISLPATLTGLAGVPLLTHNDGVSLEAWVEAPSITRRYGPVFAEYGLRSKEPKYMVREGDWKYTYWVNDVPELYNLREDPQELNNVASAPARKTIVEAMHASVLAWKSSGKVS